eukprot:SAG22_NODE_9215_length_602_cov_4.960239_1_plen_115_part_10
MAEQSPEQGDPLQGLMDDGMSKADALSLIENALEHQLADPLQRLMDDGMSKADALSAVAAPGRCRLIWGGGRPQMDGPPPGRPAVWGLEQPVNWLGRTRWPVLAGHVQIAQSCVP